MTNLYTLTILAACLVALGCSPAAPPKGADTPAPGASAMKGMGKESPDAVYDAMVAAAKKEDEKAYRDLTANDSEIESFWDTGIKQFSGTGGREEGLKQVFSLVQMGLCYEGPHKRFPAEIKEDEAQIIVVNLNRIDKTQQYNKFEFEKSGSQWYYMKKSFGPLKDIGEAKYQWDGK